MSTSFEIVHGPSKSSLFDSCMYTYTKGAKVEVSFSISSGYTTMPLGDPGCAYQLIYVRDWTVTGIEHIDNTGDNFKLRGYCKTNLEMQHLVGSEIETKEFEMTYNTQTRVGHIDFF